MEVWRRQCEKGASVGSVKRSQCASNAETANAAIGAVAETAGDVAWNAAVASKRHCVVSKMTKFAPIVEITSNNRRNATCLSLRQFERKNDKLWMIV